VKAIKSFIPTFREDIRTFRGTKPTVKGKFPQGHRGDRGKMVPHGKQAGFLLHLGRRTKKDVCRSRESEKKRGGSPTPRNLARRLPLIAGRSTTQAGKKTLDGRNFKLVGFGFEGTGKNKKQHGCAGFWPCGNFYIQSAGDGVPSKACRPAPGFAPLWLFPNKTRQMGLRHSSDWRGPGPREKGFCTAQLKLLFLSPLVRFENKSPRGRLLQEEKVGETGKDNKKFFPGV